LDWYLITIKFVDAENALNAYTNPTNQAFPLFAEIKNNDIETGYRGIYFRGNPDLVTGNTFRDIIIENNKIVMSGTDPVNGNWNGARKH